MKKILKLKENGKGNFDINSLGPDIAGLSGEKLFDLVIQPDNLTYVLSLIDLSLDNMFDKLNTRGIDYSSGRYHVTDYITVEDSGIPSLMVRRKLFDVIRAKIGHITFKSHKYPFVQIVCKRSKQIQITFAQNRKKEPA